MSRSFKQVITFSDTSNMNAWLSDRNNDKYETDIRIVGYGHGIGFYVIYWEANPNGTE